MRPNQCVFVKWARGKGEEEGWIGREREGEGEGGRRRGGKVEREREEFSPSQHYFQSEVF